MKLLQELQSLREGAMKEALMELIEKAIEDTDTVGKGYVQAVKAIIHKTREIDSDGLVKSLSDEELAEYIRDQFDEEDLKEEAYGDDSATQQSQQPQNELPTNHEFKKPEPKVIGKAGNFSVTVDEEEQIHVLDGDQEKLTMPYVLWTQLVRQ
jgi:hypothetical protein